MSGVMYCIKAGEMQLVGVSFVVYRDGGRITSLVEQETNTKDKRNKKRARGKLEESAVVDDHGLAVVRGVWSCREADGV